MHREREEEEVHIYQFVFWNDASLPPQEDREWPVKVLCGAFLGKR